MPYVLPLAHIGVTGIQLDLAAAALAGGGGTCNSRQELNLYDRKVVVPQTRNLSQQISWVVRHGVSSVQLRANLLPGMPGGLFTTQEYHLLRYVLLTAFWDLYEISGFKPTTYRPGDTCSATTSPVDTRYLPSATCLYNEIVLPSWTFLTWGAKAYSVRDRIIVSPKCFDLRAKRPSGAFACPCSKESVHDCPDGKASYGLTRPPAYLFPHYVNIRHVVCNLLPISLGLLPSRMGMQITNFHLQGRPN